VTDRTSGAASPLLTMTVKETEFAIADFLARFSG